MKKIEKEVVTKVIEGYEAMDGTMFQDQEECKKYEQSAKGVLKGRVKKLVFNEGTEDEILFTGSCDNKVWVCRPMTQDDVDTIKQLYMLCGGREEFLPRLDGQAGKVVLVTWDYDGDYMWFDSLEELTRRIMGDKEA